MIVKMSNRINFIKGLVRYLKFNLPQIFVSIFKNFVFEQRKNSMLFSLSGMFIIYLQSIIFNRYLIFNFYFLDFRNH